MRTNLILFILISFFTGCSDNFVADLSDSKTKEPILFTTLRDKVNTRYANDNHDNYHIYGFVDGENSKGWLVNSKMASGLGVDGSDYVYDGSYFWPGNGKDLMFYAYSPDTITLGINSVTADFTT